MTAPAVSDWIAQADVPAGDAEQQLADEIARYCRTAQAQAPGNAQHARELRDVLATVYAMTGTPVTETDPLEMLWARGARSAGTRACHGLLNAGKRTVADVAALTELDIAEIKNLGIGSVAEVRRVLRLAGFDLAAGGAGS
jgi:Bacterial RNA polymerase, alpha chain C terminal domain